MSAPDGLPPTAVFLPRVQRWADPTSGVVYSHARPIAAPVTTLDSDGYIAVTVNLSDPTPFQPLATRRVSAKAHRLVWEAAHGQQPPDDLVVDHINHTRTDNRIANLRLLTPGENAGTPVPRHGVDNPSARLSDDDIRAVFRTVAESSLTAASAEFGVHVSNIHYIITRRTWKHVQVDTALVVAAQSRLRNPSVSV